MKACQPKCLVEIGVETGLLTEKLVAYATEAGAVVHGIDPHPQLDVASWQDRHRHTFVFHRALSLDVLGDLPDADAVFIDGDHNWFTVFHELKLLEEAKAGGDTPPPLIAMHDVDWPYGRRDLYYDPSTIPEEYRRPHRKASVAPGVSDLVEIGMNADLDNAVSEGSARNGVRTALEDFIGESATEWSQTFIPGFHGLAVIVPAQRLEGNEALRAVLETLHSPEFLDRWARELEVARVQSVVEAEVRTSEERQHREDEVRVLQGRLQEFDRLQRQLLDAEQRLAGIPDLELQIGELERQLGDAKQATEAANRKIDELYPLLTQARNEAAVAHQWLQDVTNSPSWRITAPLRRAKHLLKRN